MLKILILQICFAILCFQGVYCSVSLRNFLHFPNIFRQTEQQECLQEQLDEHFNDLSEVQECQDMVTNLEFSDEQTDEEQQAMFDGFLHLLCTTKCGDFLFAVAEECETDDPSAILVFKPLCESNSNGDVCYEFFTTYLLNYVEIESNCITDSGTCTCESDLEDAVEDLGCCIDTYHEFVEQANEGSFSQQDLYDVCDVDIPPGCSSLHNLYIFYILYAMVVIAVMMA